MLEKINYGTLLEETNDTTLPDELNEATLLVVTNGATLPDETNDATLLEETKMMLPCLKRGRAGITGTNMEAGYFLTEIKGIRLL